MAGEIQLGPETSNPYAGIVGLILGVAFGGEIDKIIEERIDPTRPKCEFAIRGLAQNLSFPILQPDSEFSSNDALRCLLVMSARTIRQDGQSTNAP